MKTIFTACLVVSILSATTAYSKGVIKVACIGASITYGATLANPAQQSYPGQLQKMLGQNYLVGNYGVSGTTMLRHGNLPYCNTPQYQTALQSQPNIVFIDLGGNDSKLVNRAYYNEFEGDCNALIQSFTQLPTHPRVILLLPVPSFVADSTQIWDAIIISQIIPHIQQVAYNNNIEVVNMHSLFIDKEALMPDKIHPNEQGAEITAQRLYGLITQQKDSQFDVFSAMQAVEKTMSSFYGYPCADFTLNGVACKIVKPKWAATGHPWVWRARFWGHEPQTDIALLERGFHIVYCDVVELFGNDEAIGRWNDFYVFLQKAGLGKKAVMEGMSRGGVYVLNWAAVNKSKVACVYIDNPVLDLKNWPGGLGKVAAAKDEREALMKDYNIADTVQLRLFRGSPIDKTAEIVAGKYPILILCADADEAVTPAENTYLFEQEIKALNGNITVIHKPGFKHHPHSLPNPTPIVDFILKATRLSITFSKS